MAKRKKEKLTADVRRSLCIEALAVDTALETARRRAQMFYVSINRFLPSKDVKKFKSLVGKFEYGSEIEDVVYSLDAEAGERFRFDRSKRLGDS